MANFYPFLIYVFVTTFTPGPNTILSMVFGMRYGYRNILRFLLGIFAGFTMVMLLCGLLNVVLVNLLPQIEFWLNILGAVYMLYLAFHIIRSKPVDETQNGHHINTFLGGFSLQFLNLKLILYGVTVFSMFIVQSYESPLIVSLYAPILAMVGFIATSCWAVGGELFRSLLRRHYRAFNIAMGGLLIYTALASVM